LDVASLRESLCLINFKAQKSIEDVDAKGFITLHDEKGN
jgi:hypothetical protein